MDCNADDLWADCLPLLRDELSKPAFEKWILPLVPIMEENHLHIYAPNAFVFDWVRKNHYPTIARVARKCCGNERLKVSIE